MDEDMHKNKCSQPVLLWLPPPMEGTAEEPSPVASCAGDWIYKQTLLLTFDLTILEMKQSQKGCLTWVWTTGSSYLHPLGKEDSKSKEASNSISYQVVSNGFPNPQSQHFSGKPQQSTKDKLSPQSTESFCNGNQHRKVRKPGLVHTLPWGKSPWG